MSLELVNTVAQLVAALGVITGLVFVGIQVRQNTIATRAQTFHAITDSFNALNIALASSSQNARVARLGFSGLANLTDDERLQFHFAALSMVRIMETLYYQSKVGVAEKMLWNAEQRTMVGFLAFPGAREWWTTNPQNFTSEFRHLVDSLVAARPSAEPTREPT